VVGEVAMKLCRWRQAADALSAGQHALG
jgi:hypothetical protein